MANVSLNLRASGNTRNSKNSSSKIQKSPDNFHEDVFVQCDLAEQVVQCISVEQQVQCVKKVEFNT